MYAGVQSDQPFNNPLAFFRPKNNLFAFLHLLTPRKFTFNVEPKKINVEPKRATEKEKLNPKG